VPHPANPPDQVKAVIVEVWADPDEVLLTFKVEGSDSLRLPERVAPKRRDELWKTSCFELFLQPIGAEEYFEFNLSPSGEWAAYRFSGYRDGMSELVMPVDPFVDRGMPAEDFVIEADVDLAAVPPGPLRMGLSAVIEELDGTKSYWALQHPPGDRPDFHHPDCFTIDLSPASEA
jgi:hypothetical protein